nr:hypothetical protein [Tanacetum cinerariifolium]
MYNGKKGIGFKNLSYFCKAKDLRPTLYDERVIGLGYTLRFLIHSDEALEIEKFKRAKENKIEFAYDYESLNASYQTSSLKPYVLAVILKKIIIELEDEVVSLLDKEKENWKIIGSLKSKGMIKLSVLQSVSPISVTKASCASNSVETKLKRKRRKRTSLKHNVNQVNSVVSRANTDFIHFSNLDTFNSVRRLKPSDFVWKKKGSSNTVKDNLSFVYHSNFNKNVKRYSRKNLMACNNSDMACNNSDTRIAFDCNNARKALCNARMNASVDVNDLFVLMIIMRKWLPKLQPLAEPIAKWIPRIVQIYLWIINFGYSKHMMGNRALLTNFVEKFLGTVRFGNNDFAVIAGYRDVVIESMTINKFYYNEVLGIMDFYNLVLLLHLNAAPGV